jgi:hypothetical protein
VVKECGQHFWKMRIHVVIKAVWCLDIAMVASFDRWCTFLFRRRKEDKNP